MDARSLTGLLRDKTRRALLVVVALAVVFRLVLVHQWHKPAGDGLQYYALSQSLIKYHRYAYGPPPAPLTWTRPPGYPLFLAYVAVRDEVSLEQHLIRATLWNTLLDAGSLVCLFGILSSLGVLRRYGGRARATLVIAAVVLFALCPELFTLASFGLTESLTTFCGMLTLWLAASAISDEPRPARAIIWRFFGAGVALGAALLVHPGSISLVPSLALLGLFATRSPRLRGLAALAVAVGAALAYAPWIVRNERAFGTAHPLQPVSSTQDGTPMPGGFNAWNSTWGTGQRGEEYIIFLVHNNLPVPTRNIVPAMYDDEAEHHRLLALFERFRRERLSPAVDAELYAIAAERRAKHPLRSFVVLPLRRLLSLWSPLPDYDFPVRAPVAFQPEGRVLYAIYDVLLWLLVVVGGVVCWQKRQRRFALVTMALVLTRSAFFCLAHPFPVERYVVECFPLLVGLAAVGLAGLAARFSRAAISPPK